MQKSIDYNKPSADEGINVTKIADVTSVDDCCNKCYQNSHCVVYSYATSGHSKFTCWLKTGIPKLRTTNERRTSGVIRMTVGMYVNARIHKEQVCDTTQAKYGYFEQLGMEWCHTFGS